MQVAKCSSGTGLKIRRKERQPAVAGRRELRRLLTFVRGHPFHCPVLAAPNHLSLRCMLNLLAGRPLWRITLGIAIAERGSRQVLCPDSSMQGSVFHVSRLCIVLGGGSGRQV